MKPSSNPFGPELFQFLKDLAENNNRDWFQAHKARYEDTVKEPALRFISDFGPWLEEISPHFTAVPKATGGSLFRIYRDTRFSADKTPYKTHLGIRFPHRQRRDVHAPGYYLHIEPGGSFLGIGIWKPTGQTLRQIRDGIVADPDGWRSAIDDPGFRACFELGGSSLKRAPRGYDADHPLIDELRRKDFIGFTTWKRKDILAADLIPRVAADLQQGTPFMRHLCSLVEVSF